MMMSTVRQAAAGNCQMQSRDMVRNRLKEIVSGKLDGHNPNDRCELCKHSHQNSECYKQHLELAP